MFARFPFNSYRPGIRTHGQGLPVSKPVLTMSVGGLKAPAAAAHVLFRFGVETIQNTAPWQRHSTSGAA